MTTKRDAPKSVTSFVVQVRRLQPTPNENGHEMSHMRAAFPWRYAAALLGFVLIQSVLMPGIGIAQTNQWKPGPDMSTGRYSFPLVELPSGNWLIAGGAVSGNAFGSTAAEVFDSTTVAWTSINPMPSTHRGRYSGVRLFSGDVLVAGDDPHVGGHPHPRSAYRYDEGNGTWTQTADDPTINRFSGSLTRLPDGRVLHSGGYNGHGTGPTYNTADIYDPSMDSWSATGSMAAVRLGHRAILLTIGPNAGKVLVTGGSDRAPSNTSTSGCELYDPGSGTWSATGSLNESRNSHTATLLLSGQVLVVGGQITSDAVNRDSAELYDPQSGTWSLAAPTSGPRAHQTATLLLSGEVLVVGGTTGISGSSSLTTVEIYDPLSDSWSVAASMATPRLQHSAALLPDGRVIVVGGVSDGEIFSSTEIFDPALIFSDGFESGTTAAWSLATGIP